MSTSDQLLTTFPGYLNLDMSNPSSPPIPDIDDYITNPSPTVSCTLFMTSTPMSSRLASPPTSRLAPKPSSSLKHETTLNNPCICIWSIVPNIRAFNSEMEQKHILLWQNIDPERLQRPRWRSREETFKILVETYNSADKVGTMRAIGL